MYLVTSGVFLSSAAVQLQRQPVSADFFLSPTHN